MESREVATGPIVEDIYCSFLGTVHNGWKRLAALSVEYHVSLVCMMLYRIYVWSVLRVDLCLSAAFAMLWARAVQSIMCIYGWKALTMCSFMNSTVTSSVALQDAPQSRYVRSDIMDNNAGRLFHGTGMGAEKISSLGANLPGYITQFDI